MAPEVPADRKAAFIWVIGCRNGHEWYAYGENTTHFGPAQCRVRGCGEPQFSAKQVRKLAVEEAAGLQKFHVILDARRALHYDRDATVEEDVDAQGVRETGGYWEFFTGDTVVQRFPGNWVIAKPVVKKAEKPDKASQADS
jgi:hypothetical protein